MIRILVVRFRQMGDAILATPLLSTLRANFPDAEIDFVLNDRIAPLFQGHPAVNHIIRFTDDERHSFLTYIKKVWQTVHHTRYDVIIDMRSTANTMLFALFSLRSKYRIGISKPYTWGIFNHRIEGCRDDEGMIRHNLRLAEPLKKMADGREWKEHKNLTLTIEEKEKQDFRQYMQEQGVDFSRPVMLVGVTAKLADKTWPEDRMTETLRRFISTFPQWQLIFNYAPGREEENARRIYDSLAGQAADESSSSSDTHRSSSIFLNVKATSPRQLAAMAANCTAYFGNEGGARHIVHAMGRPSLVICSPGASKKTWLPQDTDILTQGIAASDIAYVTGLTRQEQYNLITEDTVWKQLQTFCQQLAV